MSKLFNTDSSTGKIDEDCFMVTESTISTENLYCESVSQFNDLLLSNDDSFSCDLLSLGVARVFEHFIWLTLVVHPCYFFLIYYL